MTTWITVNKTMCDFVNDLEPGMLLEFEDGRRMLVGDINAQSGCCSCCSMYYDTYVVVRYTLIDLKSIK